MDSLTPLEMETLADLVAERVADRMANRRRLLTRQELTEVINVAVPTLDKRLRDDPAFPRIRFGRKVLFDPHAVIAHLAKQSAATEQCDYCETEPVVHRFKTERGIVKTCDECWRFAGQSSDTPDRR
ncbi:hypothetical protein [Planctomycetes bacterium K23_9]|uniref:Helix-turn-helix domain protein n=1 Tax=Stieleria marina TaxID=1930275 RepID=A0A517NM23_9BACT|nr:hypothetical protein K239x_01180 [Planctomycetes bacterium K23_9]